MDEKAEAESVHGLTYSATYTVLSEYPSTAESRPEEVLIRPLVPEEEKTVAVSPKKREIPQQPAASDPPPLTGHWPQLTSPFILLLTKLFFS